MNSIMINGNEYPLAEYIQRDMEENSIQIKEVKNRVKLGWSYYEAVNVPKNMTLKTYRELKRKGKIQNCKFFKLQSKLIKQEKLKKPYLYNVPQQHTESEYAKTLFKNNSIARVKTDLYGQPQLV